MERDRFATVYPAEQDQRVARVLFRIILSMLAAYLIIAGVAAYWQDWQALLIMLAAAGGLALPLGLLRRGQLRASASLVVGLVLLTVTLLATIGQGIHDLAVSAYPVVIVFASLVLSRRQFFAAVLLTIAALAWLVFGEAYGAFQTTPAQLPGAPDFLTGVVILLVAAVGVNWLAENMRESLRLAQQEITHREAVEVELEYQGTHDALTGVYNRAFFEAELARLERGRGFPVSVIVADVDRLKLVNDTQGHAAGDELLRRVGVSLREAFRAEDVLARIGGDEFAGLLPHTDAAAAELLVARLRARLAEHNQRYPDLAVQLSLGAATADHGSLSEALRQADRNMYANKSWRKAQSAAAEG